MMGNKWIQAVLCFGLGLGLVLGSAMTVLLSAPLLAVAVGVGLMFVGMWKTGNCRGTDGWGGPYHGPGDRQ